MIYRYNVRMETDKIPLIYWESAKKKFDTVFEFLHFLGCATNDVEAKFLINNLTCGYFACNFTFYDSEREDIKWLRMLRTAFSHLKFDLLSVDEWDPEAL